MLKFLSEALYTDINSDYMTIYKSIKGKPEGLLKLVGTILYNYKVGKVIYSELNK